jgi:hypothetical protein
MFVESVVGKENARELRLASQNGDGSPNFPSIKCSIFVRLERWTQSRKVGNIATKWSTKRKSNARLSPSAQNAAKSVTT